MSVQRRDLSEIPLHPSLVRPILLAGAEREMVLVEVFLAAAFFAALGPHLLTLGVLAALALVVHPLLLRGGQVRLGPREDLSPAHPLPPVLLRPAAPGEPFAEGSLVLL